LRSLVKCLASKLLGAEEDKCLIPLFHPLIEKKKLIEFGLNKQREKMREIITIISGMIIK
jgi:hypothetical protein